MSHLDINPDSIFYTKEGFKTYHPRILKNKEDNLKRAEFDLRTHSAPEIVANLNQAKMEQRGGLKPNARVNNLSDVYSLGLTLLDGASLDQSE